MTHRIPGRRTGAIAPLTAILMIPLMGMVAFAIDLAWIAHTHNQLQAAADAAALAGATQLTDDYVNYYLPKLSTDQKKSILAAAKVKAKASAITYAGYNRAAETTSLRLLDADIEFGDTSASGTFTPESGSSAYPNSVKVVLRRDGSANGSLGLFFGRVLGLSSVDLTATATACIYSGSIDGFSITPGIKSRILPMTFDVNDWQSFLKGTYPSWMTVDNDANGLPRVSVYPTNKDRGNFGELSLDQSNNGASTISGWIDNGVTSTDLQANYTKGLLPLSQHDSNGFPDWKGNPGLKTSTIQSVGDHVGDLYLLPLYKPVNSNSGSYEAGSGQGSNYYYTIVQFVGVRISAVDATGNKKSIKVQPAAMTDLNAKYGSVGPASPPSGQTTLTTTFAGAKLVR